MDTYYIYTKNQRVVAYTILLNAVLLFGMYLALVKYLPEYGQADAVQENLNVINIAIWPIEIILLGLAFHFYKKNKTFTLSVSASELYYFDPTFGEVEYRIPVKDIVELMQYTNTQQSGSTNRVCLASGEYKELMYQNFHIDRKAFFAALKKANPDIILPENPYRYEVTRPQWAKNLLGRK